MPTRNIDLTDHFEAFVERSIASGRYESASEVMREGLRLLEQRQQEDALKLERLREAARLGLEALDSGDYVEIDGEDDLREFIASVGREASAQTKARRRA